MSGLNDNVTSSGDVFQNGNPNTFTGTNTFNINRPTSTITTAPGSTDFITKQNADALYGGAGNVFLNGNPNAFTGTNTFNSNRPTSTITGTPGSTDFITKQNADALYTNNTGDAILNGNNAFTGTNTFNTNRPTSTIAGTPGSTDFITKQNADALYTNNTGDAILNGNNAFTGTTNTFLNRPAASSTPATLAGTLDFVIKRDTDLLYVTKDTDQDITGKKTFENNVTLDGASNINIGQIELKGSVGNTIHQFTGSFGNQILQGTNTAGAPSMPLTASLIYQAGTNDIIETEGKVVCPTAPTSGNDLTNKTYVDAAIAAGGGGLEYFMGYDLNPNTPSSQVNMRFSNGASSSGVNFNKDTGSGANDGAKFTATATSAGNWLIGFTGANLAGPAGYGFLAIVSSRVGSIGQYFDYRPTTNQFNNTNIVVATEIQSGDVITCRPFNTFVGNQGGNFTSFWGIKLS